MVYNIILQLVVKKPETAIYCCNYCSQKCARDFYMSRPRWDPKRMSPRRETRDAETFWV